MVMTKKPLKEDALAPYVVTRALCMDGERVEVGAVIELRRVQATEMLSANKVEPFTGKAPAPDPVPEPEPDPVPEPEPEPAKPAKHKAAPADLLAA